MCTPLSINKSKKEGKDQELIQSSTTPDPGYQWESDNVTIRHHKREPRGQPFPSQQVTTRHQQTVINATSNFFLTLIFLRKCLTRKPAMTFIVPAMLTSENP